MISGEPEFRDTGYEPAALVYDLEYPTCAGDELGYWAARARAAGGTALELATGTGRVAIALAKLGYRVTGLDTSEAMLRQAEAKRAAMPPRLARRLTFVAQDMRAYDLQQTFDLVFVAFNSLLLLPSAEARLACFACSFRHVRPGGAFGFDVFEVHEWDRQPDHEPPEVLHADAVTGRRVTRERFYRFNPATNRGASTFLYRIHAVDAVVEERRFSYSLALVTCEQLTAEVERAGFEVAGIYGTYQRRPWDRNAPNLLIECRRPPR
ncbi:MAG: class I SAM-dependent methyltransferase [Actinobacteria bacterium]|nr:class I SAM-dependent methyltransferase [Actinomycetota bacterium]